MSAIMCQYCKCDGLTWRKDALGKWRLFYLSGQMHTCRATRDKIAKTIHKPLGPLTLHDYLIQYLNEAGVRMVMKRKPEPEEPPAPESCMDPWYDFLDQSERKQTGKGRAAKQEILILVP